MFVAAGVVQIENKIQYSSKITVVDQGSKSPIVFESELPLRKLFWYFHVGDF